MGPFGGNGGGIDSVRGERWEPVVGVDGLADISQLMNRWDDALGVPDSEWACIAAIAARGGVDSTQSGLAGFLGSQIEPTEYMQRPWRWLVEACRQAQEAGDHRLVCRVFLFMGLLTMSLAPKQTYQYLFTNVGLVPPDSQHQSDLAQLTVVSLEHFPPQEVLQESAAGTVDARLGRRLAEGLLARLGT